MKKTVAIILALGLMLMGCFAAVAEGSVNVTMLKSAGGNDSLIDLWRSLAEQFKEYTDGKYVLALEEIPGVAVDVRTKLKMLNAANSLPAIVSELGAEPAFAELLISNNRLLDLAPYYNESEQWQATSIDTSVTFNTEADGKMFTTPAQSTEYVGVFYNTEIFSQAGIEEFPTTWEDFWTACDKIKEMGIAPLSLHTTETGWCTMLFATAYSATQSEENLAFLRENFPSDFTNDTMLEMAQFIRKLFDYTTSDAIGGTYSLASNNFCAGKTAMIANGPWMSESFYDPSYAPEGFAEKVAYAPFPGGIMLSDEGESRGYAVSMDVSEEQQQGAIEFLKFLALPEVIHQFNLANGSMAPKAPLSDEQKATLSPILQSYASAVEQMTMSAPRYQAKWDSVVQTEVIEQELPNLAMDIITPDEFVAKLTEGAQRYLAQTQG